MHTTAWLNLFNSVHYARTTVLHPRGVPQLISQERTSSMLQAQVELTLMTDVRDPLPIHRLQDFKLAHLQHAL